MPARRGSIMAIQPHTVGIVVKDMPKALAFYRLLGLSIEDGEDHAPHVELAFDGYHLGFTTEALVRQGDPSWVEPVGQRLTLAFKLETPVEVDALYETVVAAGYAGAKAPWDAFWGERYAFLRDPDGNRVDIFAPLLGQG